jgi:hypothetical protein
MTPALAEVVKNINIVMVKTCKAETLGVMSYELGVMS